MKSVDFNVVSKTTFTILLMTLPSGHLIPLIDIVYYRSVSDQYQCCVNLAIFMITDALNVGKNVCKWVSHNIRKQINVRCLMSNKIHPTIVPLILMTILGGRAAWHHVYSN